MTLLIWVLIILIPIMMTIVGIEFGVWIMKGMLGAGDEHHAERTPLARAVGYTIGAIAFVAFLVLATGAKSWAIAALVVAIPLALVLIYRRPPRSEP
jgi:hypothetical protein